MLEEVEKRKGKGGSKKEEWWEYRIKKRGEEGAKGLKKKRRWKRE